ncbi:MAG: HAMP domain-containing histidine kinase [Nitrospirae bacterium]|nr:HAMP domain-containing histidine kinase [Nitrospirota bacterium]
MENIRETEAGKVPAIGSLHDPKGSQARKTRYSGLSSLSKKELVSVIHDLAGQLGDAAIERKRHACLRDVSQRIVLEENVAQDWHLAQLGMLAAGIAHEINNPNNFIMTNAQILADIWDDTDRILKKRLEEYGDFTIGGFSYADRGDIVGGIIAGIADGSARISEIVTSIRGATTSTSETVNESADINSSIRDAVIIMNHEIRSRADSCKFRLADNLPPVRGNQRALARVVINLLSNALKALSATSARTGVSGESGGIDISTWFDEKNSMVTLSVTDDGGGMTLEEIDHIFEPFFTTRKGSGMGLGLSISLSIVQKYGGTMEFRSSPGEGTTAIVMLPAIAANPLAASP